MKFQTKAIHVGQAPDSQTGALVTPIVTSTTFAQKSPGEHSGYEYSRVLNPTRKALEECFASLEGGRFALATASGCSAAHIISQLLKPGDEVLAEEDLYGGTLRLLDHLKDTQAIKAVIADLSSKEKVASLLLKKPRMVLIETPTNPLLKIIDIKEIVKQKSPETLLVVDNTFASPYFQNPLKFGADIVFHSATKYLGGHADFLGGLIVTQKEEFIDPFLFFSKTIGPSPSAFDSYLLLRSLKTLGLRMEAHQKNAFKVSEFLEAHPKVENVLYPGLKSHPQHLLAKQQMSGFGGVVSFFLKGKKAEARKFLENLKIFILAESLGSVESLAEHPKTMTHQAFSSKGVTENLIRLSVGIEHIDDLIKDLEGALNQL